MEEIAKKSQRKVSLESVNFVVVVAVAPMLRH